MIEFACFMKEINGTKYSPFVTINTTKKAERTATYLGRITK